MFHLAVVLKKSWIINRGLDSQNKAVLIVHLDGHFAHVVFDARALNAGIQIIAALAFVLTGELAAQKRKNVFGLDGVNSGAHQGIVDGSKILLTLKNDIRGVLSLHQAPVIAAGKLGDGRTKGARKAIQRTVQPFDVKLVGQCLGQLPVSDHCKSIVEHAKVDLAFAQGRRQRIVTVEIKLQPKRRPGGHAQVTQAKVFIDKIKIVVQAFARIRFKKSAASRFIVPGLIAGAGFHGRKDVNQALVVTALFNYLANQCFFADIGFAQVFNFKPCFLGKALGVTTDLFPQRLGPFGVVKDSNFLTVQICGHSLGKADAWNSACDNHAVKARQLATNFLNMPLGKQLHGWPPRIGLTVASQISTNC